MASLVADISALLERRGDDLEVGARRRLRRYARRLEAAQQELAGDFEMTQMPDDGEGSGEESSSDSDGGGGGGGASRNRKISPRSRAPLSISPSRFSRFLATLS